MIIYARNRHLIKNHFRLLFARDGSVVIRSLIPPLIIGLWTFIFYFFYDPNRKIKEHETFLDFSNELHKVHTTYASGLFSLVISFVIAFRCQYAMQRYNLANHHVCTMYHGWSSSFQLLVSFMDLAKSEAIVHPSPCQTKRIARIETSLECLVRWFSLLGTLSLEDLKDTRDHKPKFEEFEFNSIPAKYEFIKDRQENPNSPPNPFCPGIPDHFENHFEIPDIFKNSKPGRRLSTFKEYHLPVNMVEKTNKRGHPNVHRSIKGSLIKDICEKLNYHVLNSGPEESTAVSKLLLFTTSLFRAKPKLKAYLIQKTPCNRKRDRRAHYLGDVSKAERFLLNLSFERVELVERWILQEFLILQAKGDILAHGAIISRCVAELSRGNRSYKFSHRLTVVPFPFALAQMVSYMLWSYGILIPLFIGPTEIGWAIFWSLLTYFGFNALNEIAIDLERPFGDGNDDNDICLAEMQHDYIIRLYEVFYRPLLMHRTPTNYKFSCANPANSKLVKWPVVESRPNYDHPEDNPCPPPRL